ncbi:MAG: cell division protein ZapA [bacterium]
MSGKKTSVKVEILGESYVLRTEAAPEHTKAVAEHLDRAIRQILSGGAVIEANRAAILAALQITSELFLAREANAALVGAMQGLSSDVRRLLPPGKRDSASIPVVSG